MAYVDGYDNHNTSTQHVNNKMQRDNSAQNLYSYGKNQTMQGTQYDQTTPEYQRFHAQNIQETQSNKKTSEYQRFPDNQPMQGIQSNQSGYQSYPDNQTLDGNQSSQNTSEYQRFTDQAVHGMQSHQNTSEYQRFSDQAMHGKQSSQNTSEYQRFSDQASNTTQQNQDRLEHQRRPSSPRRRVFDDYVSRNTSVERSESKSRGWYDSKFGGDSKDSNRRESRRRSRSKSRSRSRDRRRSRERSRDKERSSRERRRDFSPESRSRRDRSRESRYRDEKEDDRYSRSRYREEDKYNRGEEQRPKSGLLAPAPTVIIQNLHLEANERDVENVVKEAGFTTRSVAVIRERNGESRGFAFVEFESADLAEQWITKVQRSVLINGQMTSLNYSKNRRSQEQSGQVPDWTCNACKALNFGSRSRVGDKKFICFKCKSVQADTETLPDTTKYGNNENDVVKNADPCNVLILRGMDFSTEEEKVRMEIVKLTAKVLYDVRLIRDKITDVSRGFAFVELGSSEDAKELIDIIEGMNPPFEIDGRRIIVGYARHGFNAPISGKKNTTATTSQVSKDVMAQNAVAQASAAQAISEYPKTMAEPYATVTTGQTAAQTTQAHARQGFTYDPTSGYYYDANTGLYYDSTTGYYYNSTTQQWLQWDGKEYKVVKQDGSVAGNTQTTSTASYNTNAAFNTAYNAPYNATTATVRYDNQQGGNVPPTAIQPTETINAFGQKPRTARKIAKDMERWAKKLNNQSETRKAAVKQAQEELRMLEQKEEELRKRISLEKSITNNLSNIASAIPQSKDGVRSLFVPENEEEGSVLNLGSALAPAAPQKPRGGLVADYPLDDDEDMIIDESMFIDLTKMACLLCQRQLMSKENLTKHLQMSQLHKQNLEKYKESKKKS